MFTLEHPFVIKLNTNWTNENSFIPMTFRDWSVFTATYNLQSFKTHIQRYPQLWPIPCNYLFSRCKCPPRTREIRSFWRSFFRNQYYTKYKKKKKKNASINNKLDEKLKILFEKSTGLTWVSKELAKGSIISGFST